MSEVGGKLIGIFAANLAEMLAADAGSDGPAPGTTASQGPTAEGADGEADAAEGDLSAPIDVLSLQQRSYNSLIRAGIRTVGELAARTATELLAMEGIGPASVQEISHRLGERGLALAEGLPAGTAGQAAAMPDTAQASTGQPSTGQPGTAGAAAGADGAGAAGAGPDGAGPEAAGATAGATAGGGPGPVATAPDRSPPLPARQADADDAIDLLSVAGLPVLKRAVPVLAGVAAAALVALRIRYRRRHRRG
jgi:hypothetical protein